TRGVYTSHHAWRASQGLLEREQPGGPAPQGLQDRRRRGAHREGGRPTRREAAAAPVEPAVLRNLRGRRRLEAGPAAQASAAGPRLPVPFLLDTNTCIDFLRGRRPAVRERIRSRTPGSIGVSVVTAAELRHGAERSTRPERSHAVLDAFLADLDILPLEEP